MSKRHLDPQPHHISETAWWYEANGGIEIVVQPRDGCITLDNAERLLAAYRAQAQALEEARVEIHRLKTLSIDVLQAERDAMKARVEELEIHN